MPAPSPHAPSKDDAQAFRVNEEVRVTGLVDAADLNGRVRRIVKLPAPGKERVIVELRGDVGHKSIKPANLVRDDVAVVDLSDDAPPFPAGTTEPPAGLLTRFSVRTSTRSAGRTAPRSAGPTTS